MQTEEAQIQVVKEGSPLAFQTLVQETRDWGFQVSLRLLADEEQARDILQDAYVKAWTRREKIPLNGSFKAWFYRVLVNTCYDALRSRKRKQDVFTDAPLENIPRPFAEEGDPLEAKEALEIIQAFLERLGAKQRAVFVLSELEGRSQEEIADLLKIRTSAVKSNLHHARQKVKQHLEVYYNGRQENES